MKLSIMPYLRNDDKSPLVNGGKQILRSSSI